MVNLDMSIKLVCAHLVAAYLAAVAFEYDCWALCSMTAARESLKPAVTGRVSRCRGAGLTALCELQGVYTVLMALLRKYLALKDCESEFCNVVLSDGVRSPLWYHTAHLHAVNISAVLSCC